MMKTTLILKHTKTISLYCMLVLLTACASAPKPAAVIIESAEKLVTEAKKSPLSSLVKDEVQRAETNLMDAKQAIKKGNENDANWYAQKAQSDAEYAKAKISASVYRDVEQKQEKNLKKHQEIYSKK